ncbi:helix-turn-helix domain-containing protein [Streptomyces sp. NPDC057686]|uniref:helix-turn-helix domain-containing protein n=1 Tax=Streptomyces sp. NPDC057686 TaxID=3346212 RepID=UPI00369BF2D3
MTTAKAPRVPYTDHRPAPMVIHGGFVVPGALAADLVAALDLLEAYVRGVLPRGMRPPGRLPPVAVAVRSAARTAAQAAAQQTQYVAANAAASTAAPKLLTPAQIPAQSSQEITTEQAATIAGITESRVRQLAAAGIIAGRKTDRNVWRLDPADVRAYRNERRRTRRGDQDRDTSR